MQASVSLVVAGFQLYHSMAPSMQCHRDMYGLPEQIFDTGVAVSTSTQ